MQSLNSIRNTMGTAFSSKDVSESPPPSYQDRFKQMNMADKKELASQVVKNRGAIKSVAQSDAFKYASHKVPGREGEAMRNATKVAAYIPTPNKQPDTPPAPLNVQKVKPAPPPKKSGPPPVPAATKPRAPYKTRTTNAVPFSAWHLSLPPALDLSSFRPSSTKPSIPKEIESMPHKAYGVSMSASSSGFSTTYIEIVSVIWTQNLSRTKFMFTWSEDNAAPSIERRDTPPPALLEVKLLKQSSLEHGDRIVQWCLAKMGQQVGNGECWTLAKEALSSIPSLYSSMGLVHGHIIYEQVCGQTPLMVDEIRRGDIVQFLTARFEGRNWSSTAGMPDHTAVVEFVSGDKLHVLQQNTGGVKKVSRGETQLDRLKSGEIRVYRPIWKEWMGGDIECNW